MKDSWFFDKNFKGLSDEIFDDVIKFFDFPLEDVEPNAMEEDWDAQFKEEDWDAQFKGLEEPYFDVLPVSPSGLCDKTRKGNTKLERITTRAEISPIEQVPESTKVTCMKSIPNPAKVSSNSKDFLQFQIYSPVSVFESSSSSSGENAYDQPVIQKRGRSKRRPLSSLSPLFSVPFISSSEAFRKTRRTAASAAESDFETFLTWKPSYSPKKKHTKEDLSASSGRINRKRSSSQESIIPRKCMHCQVTKTPQWREGPRGPKTLCNACGVRFRSGRLYPEYRPAASPTFVASLHSNCHKKVLELRNTDVRAVDKGSILQLSSKP